MSFFIKAFAILFVSFIVLDFVWLGYIAKPFYLSQFSKIGRIEDGEFKIIYWAGAAVYIFMSIAIIYFVLPRIGVDDSIAWIFAKGALFGLCAYGIYDFTNYATLKDWTIPLTLADIAWGTFLCGAVTSIYKMLAGIVDLN